ncbi:MAG: hypothetical protein OK449_04210 [Thaumarchaeota archaeon]|nr:hypothetical protein [Nitrososphaerota archaeon]
MDRRAVAATIASVIVFTTMLLANAAVYSAENSYLGASNLSAAQLQEHDYSILFVGLSSFSTLAKTQSFLQSTPMDCSSPQPYLDSLSGSDGSGGKNQSVWYSVESSWSYVSASGSAQGDALLPTQFDGFSGGDLNLQVTTRVNETFVGGLPSFSAQSVEVVHLPVQPLRAASQCLSALSELRIALSTVHSCNSAVVNQYVALARTRSAVLGSFDAGASTSTVGGHCVVSYWVMTTETGLQGVSGAFQWTVFGSGSLST